MPIIEINDLSHPGVEVYGRLTEAQLRNRLDPMFLSTDRDVIDEVRRLFRRRASQRRRR